MRSRKIIITASLGVLQHKKIKFTPELSNDKLSAINTIGMGNHLKLFLLFKQAEIVRSLFDYGDGSKFWAGEATSADENYATVHGALLSGLRAAGEIVKA